MQDEQISGCSATTFNYWHTHTLTYVLILSQNAATVQQLTILNIKIIITANTMQNQNPSLVDNERRNSFCSLNGPGTKHAQFQQCNKKMNNKKNYIWMR